MVNVEKIDKTKLYENMVKAEKAAYDSQDFLLNEIKKWFLKIMDKDVADHTKIILAQGGYIQIRTIKKVDEEDINEFKEVFNFDQTWFREETMTDFRNIETVSVDIFEYGFIPKDINAIVGDNQVELEE